MVPRNRAYPLSSSSDDLQRNGRIGLGNSNSKLKSPLRYDNLIHGMPNGLVDYSKVSIEEINLNQVEKGVLTESRNIHETYNLEITLWWSYNSKTR